MKGEFEKAHPPPMIFLTEADIQRLKEFPAIPETFLFKLLERVDPQSINKSFIDNIIFKPAIHSYMGLTIEIPLTSTHKNRFCWRLKYLLNSIQFSKERRSDVIRDVTAHLKKPEFISKYLTSKQKITAEWVKANEKDVHQSFHNKIKKFHFDYSESDIYPAELSAKELTQGKSLIYAIDHWAYPSKIVRIEDVNDESSLGTTFRRPIFELLTTIKDTESLKGYIMNNFNITEEELQIQMKREGTQFEKQTKEHEEGEQDEQAEEHEQGEQDEEHEEGEGELEEYEEGEEGEQAEENEEGEQDAKEKKTKEEERIINELKIIIKNNDAGSLSYNQLLDRYDSKMKYRYQTVQGEARKRAVQVWEKFEKELNAMLL